MAISILLNFIFVPLGLYIAFVILYSSIRSAKKSSNATCEEQYGHDHKNQIFQRQNKDFGQRYIVEDVPETGYVILNGKKRKIKDCKNL